MSKNIVKTNKLKYEFGPLPTLSNIDNNVQYDHGIPMCMYLGVYFCTLHVELNSSKCMFHWNFEWCQTYGCM